MFGHNILILVPHPDDEVVGMAAAIGRAQAEGATVFVLYLTHGCIAKEVRWFWDRARHEAHVAKRRREAEKAAAFLGITAAGWEDRPARSLWQDLPKALITIRKAIADHMIDQIWVPAYEGGNADHDGANAMASKLKTFISVLEFAEYNFFEGKAQAQTFPYPNGSEQVLLLTPEESARKKQALEIYESEKGNLSYVGVARECFRPLAINDYSKPPHPGTLWYARFQWVPFRHPRVDFTNPTDVSKVITQFLC